MNPDLFYKLLSTHPMRRERKKKKEKLESKGMRFRHHRAPLLADNRLLRS
jgi:hypothetical protein